MKMENKNRRHTLLLLHQKQNKQKKLGDQVGGDVGV